MLVMFQNVLVLGLNGSFIACALNAPGCSHISTVVGFGDVYEKLEAMFKNIGGLWIADSAFLRDRFLSLIKSVSDNAAVANSFDEMLMDKEAKSARRAAEWGM